MPRPIKKFEPCDYEGQYNLLRGERELILQALIRTNGDIKKTFKLLCPKLKPYSSWDIVEMRIEQHNIELKNNKVIGERQLKIAENKRKKLIAELKRFENESVIAKLKAIEAKDGIKLRSTN